MEGGCAVGGEIARPGREGNLDRPWLDRRWLAARGEYGAAPTSAIRTMRVAPVAERLAEISSHGARNEARVLDGQGIVEAETLAELVDVLGLDVHRQEQQHRVA